MKKQNFAMVLLVVMTGVLGASAEAQGNGCPQLRASIPFEFKVGKATLPAGDYEIQCSSSTTDQKILQLSERDKSGQALIRTSVVNGTRGRITRIVFNRYGDQYFLTQLWMAGEATGMQVLKSRAEMNVGRKLARNPQKVETIAHVKPR